MTIVVNIVAVGKFGAATMSYLTLFNHGLLSVKCLVDNRSYCYCINKCHRTVVRIHCNRFSSNVLPTPGGPRTRHIIASVHHCHLFILSAVY